MSFRLSLATGFDKHNLIYWDTEASLPRPYRPILIQSVHPHHLCMRLEEKPLDMNSYTHSSNLFKTFQGDLLFTIDSVLLDWFSVPTNKLYCTLFWLLPLYEHVYSNMLLQVDQNSSDMSTLGHNMYTRVTLRDRLPSIPSVLCFVLKAFMNEPRQTMNLSDRLHFAALDNHVFSTWGNALFY